MSTLTRTTRTNQLTVLQADGIEVCVSTCECFEVRPVEANTCCSVDEVWPEPIGE